MFEYLVGGLIIAPVSVQARAKAGEIRITGHRHNMDAQHLVLVQERIELLLQH